MIFLEVNKLGYISLDFKAEDVYNQAIDWIRNWFSLNGPECKAIIGISGGKDSTVCAKLLVDALGKDRVVGVIMPNGEQKDISDSFKVCDLLGIQCIEANIHNVYGRYLDLLGEKARTCTQLTTNLQPRIRMSILYAYAALLDGRVCNTCNFSEDYISFSTKWGDNTGDFSLLQNLLKSEVVALGDYMKLPEELVHKTPSDGLTGKTDEGNFGFTYDELDCYILREKYYSQGYPDLNKDYPKVSGEAAKKIRERHFNKNTIKKMVMNRADIFYWHF